MRAQVDALWTAASPAQRQELTARFRELQEDALGEQPSGEPLRRYLDSSAGCKQAGGLWLVRAEELLREHRLLAAQQILLRLARLEDGASNPTDEAEEADEADKATAAKATALLARMLHENGQHRQAVELGPAVGRPACRDGLPGREDGQRVRHALGEAIWQADRLAAWQGGSYREIREPHENTSRSPLPVVGAFAWSGPIRSWGSGAALMSSRNSGLILRDSLGREFFNVSLESDSYSGIHYRAAGQAYAVSRGNLLSFRSASNL